MSADSDDDRTNLDWKDITNRATRSFLGKSSVAQYSIWDFVWSAWRLSSATIFKREANPKFDYHSCNVFCAMQSHNAAANSLRSSSAFVLYSDVLCAVDRARIELNVQPLCCSSRSPITSGDVFDDRTYAIPFNIIRYSIQVALVRQTETRRVPE
jgi:hypothetical protein